MADDIDFLLELETIIRSRLRDRPDSSYIAKLVEDGELRMAQKVGEEAVEAALAAVAGDTQELLDEAADLVFHLLVLLNHKELSLADVVGVLARRHH